MSNYTFLPWVRHGLSGFIERNDDGNDIAKERVKLDVEINLKNDQAPLLNKEVLLAGPGDVIGIQPQAIIRNEPTAGTNEFEPNSLAFVEFYDEDFPWRYTSAAPSQADPDKLRPWMMLLVLKENEFTWIADSRPLPSIRITKPVLDVSPEEIWAWAHVQVNEDLMSQDEEGNPISDEEALEKLFSSNPDAALSRIICPRKLEAEQQYFAFIVPVFEVGRLAGLGEDTSTTPIQKAAWSSGQTELSFPFYHHFGFSTGENNDFETLARKLKPNPAEDFPAPPVNVVDIFEELGVPSTKDFPNYAAADAIGNSTKKPVGTSQTSIPSHITIEGSTELPIESALVSPNFEHKWFGDQNAVDRIARNKLIAQLNEADNLQQTPNASITEDPLVNIPPMHGRWHAAENAVDTGTGLLKDANWFHQLNLDPSYRMAAGIGAELVREKQDVFMQQAWEQVGELREANQKLRQAELGKEVATRLFKKHLAARDEEKILAVTQALHGKIEFDNGSTTETIHDKVTKSTMPNASLDPAFTKLIRKKGPLAKKINKNLAAGEELQGDLVTKLADHTPNGANLDITTAAPKALDEKVLLNPAGVGSLKVNDFDPDSISRVTNLKGKIDQQEIDKNATNASKVDFSNSDFNQSKSKVVNKLEPLRSIPKETLSSIDMDLPVNRARLPEESSLKTIMTHPEFEQPTFSYLIEKHPDFLSPAIGQMKNNTISLMKINQPFIESFMVGMNHAMGSELLWREYPTDQRGNYFRQFWDTGEHLNAQLTPEHPKDITPITTWEKNTPLGSHSLTQIDQDGKVVLLIKGELLKQYPNLVLFAQKATWHNGGRILDDPNQTANVAFPMFRVPLKDNLMALAFQLTTGQVAGDLLPDGNPDPAGDAGWFFMFKERTGELKFGLDTDPGTTTFTRFGSTHSTDDLHWGQVIDPTGATADQHIPIGTTVTLANQYVWGESSAEMACILQQKPFILGFHASSLINN